MMRVLSLVKSRSRLKAQRMIKGSAIQGANIEMERLVGFFFVLGVLCHNLSCLWFLVAKLQDF